MLTTAPTPTPGPGGADLSRSRSGFSGGRAVRDDPPDQLRTRPGGASPDRRAGDVAITAIGTPRNPFVAEEA